jgi:hypothetical protein
MFHRRLLASLLVLGALVGLAVPASAQKDKDKDKKPKDEKVILKWMLPKGKEFFQTMTTDTTQTMQVMGNPVTQKQKQTFYFSWKVTAEEGDTRTIEQKIIGVSMEIDIGGSKINYDTKNKVAANNPLADFFKALEDAKFDVKLDLKSLKVVDIDKKGRTEFVDKLVKANPQMKALLETILSESALKEMAEPTFAVVPPDGDVVKAKTWDRKTSLDMGPIGTYHNTYKYTYEGPEGKSSTLYKIKVDTTLKYDAPKEGTDSRGLPFKIKSADLTSKNATGTILFSKDSGRVDKSSMKLELNGTLQIEIGGQTTKVELKQVQTSEVVTSDVNPMTAAKQ